MQNEYITIVRNEEGTVDGYQVKYPADHKKKKGPIVNFLSRDEVEYLFQAYTRAGANLPITEINKNLSRFSYYALNKIITLFDLTKESMPISPHQYEEMTSDDLINFVANLKENRIAEVVKKKDSQTKDKALLKAHLINYHTEQLVDKLIEHVQVPIENQFTVSMTPTEGKKHLAIYLSDMHIGAHVNEHAIYDNQYNINIVIERLNKVLNFINGKVSELSEITIFNLGDSIDGFDNTTKRGGHYLPQNMNNEQQAIAYYDIMLSFFRALSQTKLPLHYTCVRESNHGGDNEFIVTTLLCRVLSQMGVQCSLANSAIAHTKINDTNIVYLHGKDNKNMNKPFVNLLDAKTTAYFSQYCLENNLTGRTLIVKGDQHRSALTQTNMFEYKAVSSLFGSSDWIMSNFGNTPWGVDYSFFESNGSRMDGTIKE